VNFVAASELPQALMNKDFKRFMRELRDRLLEAGIYVDRIKAVTTSGDIVVVYSDAIVVELSWTNKSVVKVRERL
jgi:hypothetical protein